MLDPFAAVDFAHGGMEVPQQLHLVEQSLVFRHIEDDGRAVLSLRQNQGASGLSDPTQESRGVRLIPSIETIRHSNRSGARPIA